MEISLFVAKESFILMNELLWLLMLGCNFFGISLAYRFWGKAGLYSWIALAAIVANIQVLKTVSLFGLTATLGNIVYATSFLATDILSENYGSRAAKQGVFLGFFILVASTLIMQVALLFRPDATDTVQEALKTIFSVLPRITAASLCAYLLSQWHDVWAYDFWRRKFPLKKHIWIRNNFSTFVSQAIDSAVFVTLAFAGVFPPGILLEIFVSTYVLKWFVALGDTPFVYLARNWKDRGLVRSDRMFSDEKS